MKKCKEVYMINDIPGNVPDESYDIDFDTAMMLAVYVHDAQGFIKSGHGYYDVEREVQIFDNSSMVKKYVLGLEPMPDISDEQKTRAGEIVEFFRNHIVTKKLMGTMSDFENTVLTAIAQGTQVYSYIGVIASLPNSYRVSKHRQEMEDWFYDYRSKSEYIGTVKEQLRLTVMVKDVKYIQTHGIHLVTCYTDDDNIVKFFFNKNPDISGLIKDRRLIITGKVKMHEVSSFSKCKETVLNYIKFH